MATMQCVFTLLYTKSLCADLRFVFLREGEFYNGNTTLSITELYCRGHVYTEGVEVLPVKAFRLEPILTGGRHPGNLTVDGELVRTETIQVGDTTNIH